MIGINMMRSNCGDVGPDCSRFNTAHSWTRITKDPLNDSFPQMILRSWVLHHSVKITVALPTFDHRTV